MADVREVLRQELAQTEAKADALRKALQALGGGTGRRGAAAGRRTMSAAQRKAVSARMKKYWAARKKAAK